MIFVTAIAATAIDSRAFGGIVYTPMLLPAVFVVTGELVASLALTLALGGLRRPVELASAVESAREE